MKFWRLPTVLLTATAVFAQEQSQPVIRIDVNLVQVDAVVTDSQNRHVSDLKAEDFIVLQDGKPQAISNFSYISGASRPAPVSAPAVRAGSAPAPVTPPIALKPAEVRRLLALVVDDLGLSFASVVHVREAVRKFVDEQMQPGDMVAIIRTSGGLGVLQQFTNDKNLLRAACDHIKYTMGRVGVSSFGALGQNVDPHTLFGDKPSALSYSDADSALDQVRTQTLLVGTLGAIRYVVDGLRDLPGRKSVVLFSESLDIFDRTGAIPTPLQGGISKTVQSVQAVDEMHRLVDAANRASVVIDTIDPRGLQGFFPTAQDRPSIYGGADPIGASVAQRSDDEFNSRTGLWALAEETGGLFIRNNNFVDQALTQAVADSDGYYLIGYHPDSDTFDPATGKAKYHRLQIKLKTAGLRVRTRNGFFGESDAEARAVTRSGHDDLMHALLSPFSSGAVPVRLTALFEQSTDGRGFLNALLHIDAKSLKFTEQPDGARKATLEMAVMTFGQNGQPADQSDRQFGIALSPAEYQATVANGLVYQLRQPLAHPGLYQVRAGLRDQDSGQLGSASQFTEAPDLKTGHLAMSSILLVEDAGRAGGPEESTGEGRVAASDPATRAAERVFKPGAALSYEYAIFNAATDAAGKPDLRVQARLFRDGQQVYAGPSAAPALAGKGKHLIAGGQLGLAKNTPAGDYLLQVIVKDRLAKEKFQTSWQSMDFEIRQ